MNSVDKATETQLSNIQTRTGKTRAELFALIRESGLTKHGQIRVSLTAINEVDAELLAWVKLAYEGAG